MKLAVGILAHNEEAVIGRTIRSLASQSTLAPQSGVQVQVVVVPNGCTDRTPQIARDELAEAFAGQAHVSTHVEVLAEGDKGAAWNVFVHDVAAADSDYIVLIDADIEFCTDAVISRCLGRLQSEPDAVACVDVPTKVFRDAVNPVFRKLSTRYSGGASQPQGISGQFYMARSESLRTIWIPPGLAVEDGFIYCHLITRGFTAGPQHGLVVVEPDAAHLYEAEATARALLRHETRIVIGTAVNEYLVWNFLFFVGHGDGSSVGDFLRERCGEDPTWLRSLLEKQVQDRGFWVLPRGIFTRRLTKLRRQAEPVSASDALLATAAFLADMPVTLRANRMLKDGRAFSFW